MSSADRHLGYRADIDGLRAVAVLAVVAYHAAPQLMPGGFVGVDVFFVISGYLISSLIFADLNNQRFSVFRFYSRRVKRIFPALTVVLGLTLLVNWFVLLPMEYKQLGKHVIGGAGFASNLVLWSEAGYFDAASESKPLLHLWSLGIEEQFYLFWPLFLGFVWKKRRKYLLFAVVFLSFAFSVEEVRRDAVAAFYSPLSRLWELGIGSLLAWLAAVEPARNVRVPKFARDLGSTIGLLLVAAAILVTRRERGFPGAWALLPTIGTALLIASGPGAWCNRTLLALRPMVWLGLISYPLYLWHWPLLVLSRVSDALAAIPVRQIVPAAVLASIALAWLTYRFVEKPIRTASRQLITIAALCTTLAATGILGLVIFKFDGLAYRYPSAILDVVSPIDFRFTSLARFGTCHYDSGVPGRATVGAPGCIEDQRPLVFVWGDSYAAALYPGLKSLQSSHRFGIAQATSCGTPPFVGLTTGNACVSAAQMNRWNEDTLEAIARTRPQLVLLHAFWTDEFPDDAAILDGLARTIPRIKAMSPLTRIAVVGPVPQWGRWNDGLPRSIYRYWQSHHQVPPDHMTTGLTGSVATRDQNLSREIPKLGVSYLSAYQALCHEDGCLIRVGPKATDLTAIDQGHLSEAGSSYLFSQLADQVFALLR